MRYLLVLLLAGCATAKPEGQVIPPEVLAQCQEEGGCTLYSLERLQAELLSAFQLGVQKGAAAEAHRRGAL